MYLPRLFDESDATKLHALMHANPLAMVVTRTADGLDASPVPLVYEDGFLRGHIARANPLWKTFAGEVLCLFQGGDAYVSPTFYPSKAEHGEVVPTWNYRVVEARGTLRVVHDADWLLALVTRLTNRFEATSAKPWQVSDAPPEFVGDLLKAIVGLEITVTSLFGKWKMSQNRTPADAHGVERGLRERARGDDLALADAMSIPREQ